MNKLNESTRLYIRKIFCTLLEDAFSRAKTVPAMQEAEDAYRGTKTHGRNRPLQQLCQSLELTELEFFQRFLEPWAALDPQQMQEVAKYWNMLYLPSHSLLMDLTPISQHRAIQWTMVNVFETHLFEMFVPDYKEEFLSRKPDIITRYFLAAEYSLPFKQCRYCGRLDSDPRGKLFTQNKLKLCHAEGCESNPNYNQHKEGCCFKSWQPKKTLLIDQCRDYENNLEKLERVFTSFFWDRYEENLKIQTPVRVKKERPFGLRTPFDNLGIIVHQEGKLPKVETLPLFS